MVAINDGSLYLINSPAGSGKTYTIKKMISKIVSKDEYKKVLCITFTNRAADELINGISSEQVRISTIHSFIDSFFKIYFTNDSVIDLYLEVFRARIESRILNAECKENVTKSNERFIEEFGELTLKSVKDNLSEIKYNEMPYSSLYYGRLSHDDLLLFSKRMLSNFSKIRERLFRGYNYVFIDEYQDTTSDVLELFHDAIIESDCKLLLFGDKMQQIYKNYDGTFDKKLDTFDNSNKLLTNYRSTQLIIDILNKLYNDTDYFQIADDKTLYDESYKPQLIISNNVDETTSSQINSLQNPFILYLSNRKRFEAIEAYNIYDAVNKMDEYSHGRKYSAVDVLTKIEETNDICIHLLHKIRVLINTYQKGLYGELIKEAKRTSYINAKVFEINLKKDKVNLKSAFTNLNELYFDSLTGSIEIFLNEIRKLDLIQNEYLDAIIDDPDYLGLISVDLNEFENVYKYLESPKVSTQHGVKGEGHENVIYVADESANLDVSIYRFFEIIASADINLTDFQQYYFAIRKDIDEINESMDKPLDKFNAQLLSIHKDYLIEKLNVLNEKYKDNVYYNHTLAEIVQDVLMKAKVGNIKKVRSIDTFRIINAYRLFYVGCSRARKKLVVIVDSSKICNYKVNFISKIKTIGFNVIEIDKLNN